MNTWEMARRSVQVARGLRRLVRDPVTPEEARRTIADEVARRDERLLTSLDRLVWPFPTSPVHRLLDAAALEHDDVAALVRAHGVTGALERLRDAGVYLSYEEYHGRSEVRRGTTTFTCTPPDLFNPVTTADYLATTGGTSGTGTPVELSFAWQRRQGVQRPVQHEMAGIRGLPTAVWLPVFPSAAGFGAVMKNAAGGASPARWFSQVPTDLAGISDHKATANRYLPALNALARTGLPSPEHVPSDAPEPVVRWLSETVGDAGGAGITGYASSITAAARWAIEHGVDLSGVVAFPSSEPVTAGKLATMSAAGMRPFPMYAFVPEGTVALRCQHCADEEYHVWEQDVAVIERTRSRGDGQEVQAFLWTSLALEAPRVLLNVENDDYGTVTHDVDCACDLGSLGLRTRISGIRGISKVVTAGISLDGELFDHLTEVALPERLGGRAGDYQFVEQDSPTGTVVVLRVHPRVGELDVGAARDALRSALSTSDNGALAASVWGASDGLVVERDAPIVTLAGKTLSFDRLRAAAPRTG